MELDLTCACMGASLDDRCVEQATQEDGLCDHCRIVGQIREPPQRCCEGVTHDEWEIIDRKLLIQAEMRMREG